MLAEYGRVSIAFDTSARMQVTRGADGAFVLAESPLPAPIHKEYDVPGEGPLSWPLRFDVSRWTFFAAYAGAARVGGAAMVMDAPEIEMLGGSRDVALLWDIRVASSHRRRGVGAALLAAVEDRARARGARTLLVETQDINVAACRFYANAGFALWAVDGDAYPELPDEMQLLWCKALR